MADSTQLGLEVGVSLGVIGAVALSGLGVLIRYRLKEGKISQMIWKIDYHEIVFSHSSSSALYEYHPIQLVFKPIQLDMSEQNVYQSTSFTIASEDYGVAGKPTAIYRGQSVHVHKVEHTHEIKLTRQELVELVNMKEINHDNILAFVGACVDPGNICYVTTYCGRGSVQSLVDDDEIKLDWVFKMSMISDIVNGMQYLHKSAFQSHGHLTSNNCYVDSRWVVKIGGFGLRSFRNEMEVPKMGEVVYYRKMLWTSPELLRTAYTRPTNGTQKGDVYSFSIIVQQILYRAQPYFGENVEPKVIIERVMSRPTDQPCYRPTPPSSVNDDEMNPQLVTMMKQCWAEDPTDRPTFADLLLTLRRINNGRKIDIVSSMLQKLEKYAENLEQTVKQRTMELEEEKRKTDLLLYRMLPAFVADELKAGRTVAPQVYESATVYFSDIVGYTRLSSESTPLEVVDLLNDLYNLFDDVILRYDVYKVETIGDAYMVVSGLPKTNDGQHICEISNMALSLLDEVYRFKIRHRPNERIKLRIGIHTGLCAAGVVGHAMPRYCLFGDTVNVASRMESTGEALKIHLSQWAHDALMKYPGYIIEPRGETFVKGKGMLPTYWLLGRQDAVSKFLVPTAAAPQSTTGNATNPGPNVNA